jgi:hypothetical protein
MKAPVGKGDDDPIAEEGSAGDRDQPVQYGQATGCDESVCIL